MNADNRKQALMRDLYEENQKLLGRDLSVPHKIKKRSAVVLLLAIMISLLFGSSEETGVADPTGPVEELLSAEQQVQASLDEIRAPEPGTQPPLLSDIYGLSVKTIALDPGHGGHDPGAIGRAGLTEKTINLDLALRLEKRLRSHGFHVILTRRQDISVDLRKRIELIHQSKADLLVSIHVNALPVDTLAFIETLYFSPRANARIETLAARENYHAGYSIGQWQSSLEEVGQTMQVEDSRRLAEYVQRALVSTMREKNPNLADWGIRSGPFIVLMYTTVPAIMAEVTAISMPEEEQRLLGIDYREQLVTGLESGILAYLSRETQVQIKAD